MIGFLNQPHMNESLSQYHILLPISGIKSTVKNKKMEENHDHNGSPKEFSSHIWTRCGTDLTYDFAGLKILCAQEKLLCIHVLLRCLVGGNIWLGHFSLR